MVNVNVTVKREARMTHSMSVVITGNMRVYALLNQGNIHRVAARK